MGLMLLHLQCDWGHFVRQECMQPLSLPANAAAKYHSNMKCIQTQLYSPLCSLAKARTVEPWYGASRHRKPRQNVRAYLEQSGF